MSASRVRPAAAPARRQAPGEFELLAQVRSAVEKIGRGPGVIVGIGDDAAVVASPSSGRPLALTTDSMIEGVHYRASWLTPKELGARAFRAAVSDVAAMGARPRFVLLSLEIPADDARFGATQALQLVRAVAAEARKSGATLVGGNVSAAPRTGVTVTVVGEAAGRPLLRRGAKAGDLVFVTGTLGGAAAGWRSLLAHDEAKTRNRVALLPSATSAFRRPPLRIEFAALLAARGLAHAMVDVSDGLLQDLGHLATQSQVALRIDAGRVPVHAAARRFRGSPSPLELALSGGEDYELAFTAPAAKRPAIEKVAAATRTPLRVVGVVGKGPGAVTDPDGRPFALASTGHDHLRNQAARPTRKA
ncbi:MAG: thiamine-phosphate kinase [Candidatus Binatia bacterium]